MKFKVVSTKKQEVGEIDLDDSVFAAEVRHHLFWEVVKMQLANRRRGTHSTKTTGEVRGSGSRPYRQKGTGRARHGTRYAMNMRGGGVVFGPRPRDHGYRVPKKVIKVALRSALSLRMKEGNLLVVGGWQPAEPRTKDALAVLDGFGVKKALVVGVSDNRNLALSIRNLPAVKFLPVEGLNVYDVLKYDHLILCDTVIEQITERLATEPSRSERALKEAADA